MTEEVEEIDDSDILKKEYLQQQTDHHSTSSSDEEVSVTSQEKLTQIVRVPEKKKKRIGRKMKSVTVADEIKSMFTINKLKKNNSSNSLQSLPSKTSEESVSPRMALSQLQTRRKSNKGMNKTMESLLPFNDYVV